MSWTEKDRPVRRTSSSSVRSRLSILLSLSPVVLHDRCVVEGYGRYVVLDRRVRASGQVRGMVNGELGGVRVSSRLMGTCGSMSIPSYTLTFCERFELAD